jgi:hypothetical protein
MHNSGTSKKKARTDDGPPNVLAAMPSAVVAMPSVAAMSAGRPAAVTAPPPVQSVVPAFRFHQPTETWGDGMAWGEMDHVTKLRFLTPRVVETGRLDRPDTGFFDCLPQAVKDPVSAKREAQVEKARKTAVKEIERFFKQEEQADERHRKEQERNERDDDESSDEYPSSDEGMITKKFRWQGKLSKEDVVEFVNKLPLHLTFTASFDATGSDERQTERCYCPCSTRKSKQWLEVAGPKVFNAVAGMKFNSCNKGKCLYQPFALLDHLREHKQDPLHLGVLVYVTELYTHYYGMLDHEALYKVGDPDYKKAIAHKTRQFET